MTTLTPAKYIKIQMLKKGITAGDIGRKIGVTRQAVSKVINKYNNMKSAKIRGAICDATGLPMTIWAIMDED